jgi:hypothetical protein
LLATPPVHLAQVSELTLISPDWAQIMESQLSCSELPQTLGCPTLTPPHTLPHSSHTSSDILCLQCPSHLTLLLTSQTQGSGPPSQVQGQSMMLVTLTHGDSNTPVSSTPLAEEFPEGGATAPCPSWHRASQRYPCEGFNKEQRKKQMSDSPLRTPGRSPRVCPGDGERTGGS